METVDSFILPARQSLVKRSAGRGCRSLLRVVAAGTENLVYEPRELVDGSRRFAAGV
jgi:hypothetical protein